MVFQALLSATKFSVAPGQPEFPFLNGRHLTHEPYRNRTGTIRVHFQRHTKLKKNDTRQSAKTGRLSLPELQARRHFRSEIKKTEKFFNPSFCHIFSFLENVQKTPADAPDTGTLRAHLLDIHGFTLKTLQP